MALQKSLLKEAIEAIETEYHSVAHPDISIKATKIKLEDTMISADLSMRHLGSDGKVVKTVFAAEIYTRARIEEKIAEIHGAEALSKTRCAYIKIPCCECTRADYWPSKGDFCGLDKEPLSEGRICPLDARAALKKTVLKDICKFNDVDLTIDK